MAIVGYEYRMRLNGTSEWDAAVDLGPQLDLSEVIGSLTASTTYDFQVRGYDAEGQYTDWSNIATATTLGISAYDPVLWLRPEELQAAYADTDEIEEWADVSGLDNHAVGSSGGVPTFDAGVLNGYGGAKFENSADVVQTLAINAGPGAWPTTSGVAEIVIVLKAAADPPVNGLYSGSWYFSNLNSGAYYPLTDGHIYEAFGSTGGSKDLGDPGTPLDQFHIYSVYSQDADFAAYINRSLLYSTSSNTFAFTSSPTIGQSPPLAVNTPRFKGHIVELILWDKKLTTEQREAIWTYLEDKYDL